MVGIVNAFKQELKRPWKDKGKLGVFVLLSIIPIVNFITIGYLLKSSIKPFSYLQLPPWADFWNLFKKGLGATITALIYAIIFTSFAWFFDYVPGIWLVPVLLVLLMPKIFITYAEEGMGAAFSPKAWKVFNTTYLKILLTGTLYTAIISIPVILLITIIAMLIPNTTVIEIAQILLSSIITFFAGIPMLTLVSKENTSQ